MGHTAKPPLLTKTKLSSESTGRKARRITSCSIAAAKAKAEFLGLIEQVSTEVRPITVTKRGKPMVQIVPVSAKSLADPFGCMKGSVRTMGDVVGPESDMWEATA